MKYPEPSQEDYLIIEIEKEATEELGISSWNYKKLSGYKELEKVAKNAYTLAGIFFTVSLSELMKNKT